MQDWIRKLHDFLTLNEREILEHAGRISAEMAKELAESEFEKFREQQIALKDAGEMKSLEAELKKLNPRKRK
jgi:hypothetical protein